MFVKFNSVTHLFLILIALVLGTASHASIDEAWQAIHDLEIERARDLFEEALSDNPHDFAAMRGLYLVSYFDMDHEAQVEMLMRMIEDAPDNPYLTGIYEHVYATMNEWGDRNELIRLIGEGLRQHSEGGLNFQGRHLIESANATSRPTTDPGWRRIMGYPEGMWVCGPYENNSNIAAYRNVPAEEESLDTMAVSTGKGGMRVGWSWIPSTEFGQIYPDRAIAVQPDIAFQTRLFFELPDDMDVHVILGGAFAARLRIDGVVVHDDPVYRNASIREGFLVSLEKGVHEVTGVFSIRDQITTITLGILDKYFRPVTGIKWLRHAEVPRRSTLESRMIHPVFQPFNEYVLEHGAEPNTRFWRSYIEIHNGYAQEAIEELETAFRRDELSLLESCALSDGLSAQEERAQYLKHLGRIHEAVSVPLIDIGWVTETEDNYEESIKALVTLDEKYPGNPNIEIMVSLQPLFTGDYVSVLAKLDSLTERFPKNTAVHDIKQMIYQSVLGDNESALREFLLSCEKSGDSSMLILNQAGYIEACGRLDDAIEAAELAHRMYPYASGAFEWLFELKMRAQRAAEMIPLLIEQLDRFPYDADIHDMLYEASTAAGQLDRARQALRDVHELNPSAISPYSLLDSLHHGVPYDSIFGSVDVMGLWEEEPSAEELGPLKYWYVCDRRQNLVFASGLILRDVHMVKVVLDQEQVSEAQETWLGFDSDLWFNTLLVARRLRKGEPPLSGEVNGGIVLFQDLKPGDAIELHYRMWSQRDGDLFSAFWDTYMVNAGYYQRYWEYHILTDRDDLRTVSAPPAGEPEIGTHCGFRSMLWKGEKVPAYDYDFALTPPAEDLLGKVYITSIRDWDIFNKWYASISEALLDKNPRSEALADSLTVGLRTDAEKLEALFKYIVHEIPYQRLGLDYHASIPQKPDIVLENHWGDCKDKGHLLISMLRHVGVEAWPVLLQSRDQGSIQKLPVFDFDHLIVSCLIDGDTAYVDATDVPFPPRCSLTNDEAGQPMLLVNGNIESQLLTLPPARPENRSQEFTMMLSPGANKWFDLEYHRSYNNLNAGWERSYLKGLTMPELIKRTETSITDSWGVTLSLDSIVHDPVESLDPAFMESLYGAMELNIQNAGALTLVTLPRWAFFNRSMIPRLTKDGKRDCPVDLSHICQQTSRRMELVYPPSYGEPQLTDDVTISDSLWSFSFAIDHDRDEHKLILQYEMEIKDGQCAVEPFTEFAKEVIGIFDTPLVFQTP